MQRELTMLDFSHQDCRDRSFRNQDLLHASFEGADVRGCDFRGANLTNATFKNAKLGASSRQQVIVLATVSTLGLISFHALSHMFFGGLGTIRDDPAWGFVLALQISLAIAGGMTGLQWTIHQNFQTVPVLIRRLVRILGMMAICALIGFFYGGDLTQNNPNAAILSAVICGVLGVILGWKAGPRGVIAGLTLVGAIAAYGFFFSAGISASTNLQGRAYGWGCLWLGIATVYLKWTLDALMLASQQISRAMATCFDPF